MSDKGFNPNEPGTREPRWVIVADTMEVPAPEPRRTFTHVMEFLLAIAERKRMVAAITAGVTLLAVALAFLLPVKYTARAQVLPPQQNQSAASLMLGQLGDLATLAGRDIGLKNPNLIYVALLRSHSSVDPIIREHKLQEVYDVELMSEARRQLEKVTSIELTKEGVIQIQVTDRDRDRAAALANAYVQQMRTLNSRLATTEAAQRRLFFEQQIEVVKKQLAEAETALRKAQESSGMLQPDAQVKAAVESVARARGELAAREAEVQRIRAFATAENPDLVRAERELKAIREHVARLEASSGFTPGAISASQIPAAGLEFIRRLRDVKYQESVFEFMAKQLEAAKIDEAKSGSLVQVLDVAEAPDKRSSPRRTLIVLAGLISGLLLGMISALAAHLRTRRTDEWSRVLELRNALVKR